MLNNIQILRGFAALLVMFHHTITYQANKTNPIGFYDFFQGWGQIGVDIFFIISGFIIFYSQVVNPKSISTFLKNRVIRIVPLYWFLTISIFLVSIFIPNLFESGWEASIGWVLKSLFFTSLYFDGSYPVIYLGWTLEYEMLFYFIFSMCIFLKNKLLHLAGTFIILLILYKFKGFDVIPHADMIFFEFILGMIVALIYLKFNIRDKSIKFLYISISLFVIITLFIDYFEYSPSFRLMNWGIISALLIFIALIVKQSKNKKLVYLGTASYSLYLSQFFSIPIFYKLTAGYQLNSVLWFFICFTFAILVGLATYFFVERNLSLFFKKYKFI